MSSQRQSMAGSKRQQNQLGPDPPRPSRASLEQDSGAQHTFQDITVRSTVILATVAFALYMILTVCVKWLLPVDVQARLDHAKQVPQVLYQMTATAFFTAFVLNITSFIFEDSVAKRQLALLSCTIKAAACYSDLLLVSDPHVMYDLHSSLFVPQRYAQWSVTTPLMVYILSKMSDFTPGRTFLTMAADMAMVATGLAVHFTPAPFHWLLFLLSCVLFCFVIREMGQMVLSAITASSGDHSDRSRRSLVFIYVCTVVIWTLFPVAFLSTYFCPEHMFRNEAVYMFANFTAKVLFSSSIMYGNYMTITQRKLLQKAEEENQNRIAMVTELTEAVTRKDQFMSLMSHELRTPLNGVIQLSDALSRGAGGELNAKGVHFITTIKNSSNHLLNIINDILDVAALKEGKLTIKHELVNLSKAISHVVDIVSPLAKKDVRIEQYVDSATPLIIADFSRMIQILYNLMGNSLKFTKSGYVRVAVVPRDATGTHVVIKVEDTGIGIPKDKIGSIWGAFEQVDMSVTRKYGGTGLGLNIVKQLVASHDGTITVDSTEGVGTTFTIHLPVLQRCARASIEQQVFKAASELGYHLGDLARTSQGQLVPGSNRTSTTNQHPLSPALQTLSHSQHANGLRARSGDLTEESDADELLKKRTMELERDALLNDLARRTDHKRSIDKDGVKAPVPQMLHSTPARAVAPSAPNSPLMPAHRDNRAMLSDKCAVKHVQHSQRRSADFNRLRDSNLLPRKTTPARYFGINSEAGDSSDSEMDSETDDASVRSVMNPALARMLQSTGRKSLCGPARSLAPSLAGRHLSSEAGVVTLEDSFTSQGRGGKGSKGGKGPRSLPARSLSRINPVGSLSLDRLAYSAMFGSVQILCVDDEEVNQIVLEEILTSAGYLYARAMDGQEALEWLEQQQTLPDLILLDCMMPNMSGHEFCQKLRQCIPSSVLPVIMVSAKSDNDNIVEGLKSGSNDFIRKPYQREELLARIETQLRLKSDSWWLAELMNNQDGRDTESMKLLKNILPESIIERMQSGQKFVADSHSHVVILFSDIVGFTTLSSKIPTAEVFLMLCNMFNAFDKLTDRFSVYKVETIGDAYMVAAGHDEDPNKARKGTPIERVVAMAKAMLDVVEHITAPNGERLKIRIGIHCGPAFAGVIGSKCPRYCFLGDTVNTASRMESLSFPMCIQLSASAYNAWPSGQEHMVCLGERSVKGKGIMTTYLLKYGDYEHGQQELVKQTLLATASNVSTLIKEIPHSPVGEEASLPLSARITTDVVETPSHLQSNALFDTSDDGLGGVLERTLLPSAAESAPDSGGGHRGGRQLALLQNELALTKQHAANILTDLAAEKMAAHQAKAEAETERARADAALDKLRGILVRLNQQRTFIAGMQVPEHAYNGCIPRLSQTSSMASGQLNPSLQATMPLTSRSGAHSQADQAFMIQAAKATTGLSGVTTRQLLCGLGLNSLAMRFEAEAIRLDQLLTMELPQLQALGLQPLGYCMRVRSAVTELAANLLRSCEDAALASSDSLNDDGAATMTGLGMMRGSSGVGASNPPPLVA